MNAVVVIVTGVEAPAIVGVELKPVVLAARPVTTGTVTEHATEEPVPAVNVRTTLVAVEDGAVTAALLGLHAVVNVWVAAVTVNVKVAAG